MIFDNFIIPDMDLLIKSSLSDSNTLISDLQNQQREEYLEVGEMSSEEEIDVESTDCLPKSDDVADVEKDVSPVEEHNSITLPSSFDSGFVHQLSSEV